jgi:hypothetical protein
MSQFRFLPFFIFIYLLIVQPSTIECRPRTQRIIINGHEWTVPNKPGWEDGNISFFSQVFFYNKNSFILIVLQEAEPIRYQLLSNCATSRECRLAAEKLREVFLRHPISSKYYDDSLGNNFPDGEASSIFKWG